MISEWLDAWFGKPPVEKRYRLALLDLDGSIVKTKTYRVYRDMPEVNEMQAQMLGRELARDAHALTEWPNA